MSEDFFLNQSWLRQEPKAPSILLTYVHEIWHRYVMALLGVQLIKVQSFQTCLKKVALANSTLKGTLKRFLFPLQRHWIDFWWNVFPKGTFGEYLCCLTKKKKSKEWSEPSSTFADLVLSDQIRKKFFASPFNCLNSLYFYGEDK